MKILWAERMAKEINGFYEHYQNKEDEKTVVRIYTENNGINRFQLKKLQRMKPRNFSFIGIYWCYIAKNVYILFYEN